MPQLPLSPLEEMVMRTITSELVSDAEYTVVVYAMTDVGNFTSHLSNFSELYKNQTQLCTLHHTQVTVIVYN